MVDAASAADPPVARLRRDTSEIMMPLEQAVAEAERLEAAGKIREAAELTARVMVQTKTEYLQVAPKPPRMRPPSQSYMQRYRDRQEMQRGAAEKKGQLDWNRLRNGAVEQRCAPWLPAGADVAGSSSDGPAAAAASGGGGGVPSGSAATTAGADACDADGGDGDGESDDEVTDDVPSAVEALGMSASSLDAGDEAGEGVSARLAGCSIDGDADTPDSRESGPTTLARTQRDVANSSEVATVEVSHTCTDGSVVSATFVDPCVPAKMVHMFNKEAKRAVQALIDGEPICGRPFSHADIALWLITSDRLSKNKIGDYLGRTDEHAVATLDHFVRALDFGPFVFDEALRFFLSLFRLPGEAQQIGRIMEKFADAYARAHPSTFSSADTAYVLAYSLIMLNVDAHSEQIANKMTLDQFVNNNRGIGENGADLPRELLASLYTSIVQAMRAVRTT